MQCVVFPGIFIQCVVFRASTCGNFFKEEKPPAEVELYRPILIPYQSYEHGDSCGVELAGTGPVVVELKRLKQRRCHKHDNTPVYLHIMFLHTLSVHSDKKTPGESCGVELLGQRAIDQEIMRLKCPCQTNVFPHLNPPSSTFFQSDGHQESCGTDIL